MPLLGISCNCLVIFLFSLRYDKSTGEFTVPAGGAGLYFFFVNTLVHNQENGNFVVRVNGGTLCRAYTEKSNSGVNNRSSSSCAGVVNLMEGNPKLQSDNLFHPTHQHTDHCTCLSHRYKYLSLHKGLQRHNEQYICSEVESTHKNKVSVTLRYDQRFDSLLLFSSSNPPHHNTLPFQHVERNV